MAGGHGNGEDGDRAPAALPDPEAGPLPPPAHAQDPSRTSPRLLEALVCPATGAQLHYDAARGELVSRSAGLAFPIRSGIPIMLIDEARRLEE